MAFRVGGIQGHLWFGGGVGGDVTFDADNTLFGDINARKLVLDGDTNGAISINTGGYRIFGVEEIRVKGVVLLGNPGSNGATNVGLVGGAGGAGAPGFTVGAGGYDGADGGTNNGSGEDAFGPEFTSVAGSGGNGGKDSTLDRGQGGAAGWPYDTLGDPINAWIMMLGGSALGAGQITKLDGGGGGGGGSGNSAGVAGAGGGGGGGVVFLGTPRLILEPGAALSINVSGGDGGNIASGGAGAGGGGGGGMIVLCYGVKELGAGAVLDLNPHGGHGGNSLGGLFLTEPGIGGSAGLSIQITESSIEYAYGTAGTDGHV